MATRRYVRELRAGRVPKQMTVQDKRTERSARCLRPRDWGQFVSSLPGRIPYDRSAKIKANPTRSNLKRPGAPCQGPYSC